MDAAILRHLLALARLSLSETEAAKAGAELASILDHFRSIDEAPVEGVPPFSPADLRTDVWRADEARPSLPAEEALRAAPERDGPFFLVPKAVPTPVRGAAAEGGRA